VEPRISARPVHRAATAAGVLAFCALAACTGQIGDAGGGGDAATAGDDDAAAAPVDAAAAEPDAYAPANRFGIGLVGPGDTTDWDLAADLTGAGGHVLLIFPGITRDTSGPDPAWVTAIDAVYDRQLIPVVRMAPPWGDRAVRNQSDDAGHRSYLALAAAYRRVVDGLPRRDGLPLWIEVHNEPNLCDEWTCRAGEGPNGGATIDGATIAAEYAAFLRDAADALHAIGDPRVRVMNAGLAPGGVTSCSCGGDGFTPGATSMDFLGQMAAAAPGVFDRLDGFASHAYPAQGEGWGFFVPFDQAGPGLAIFAHELEVVGRSLPVFVTETGWSTDGGSREEIAGWTVRAYRELWLTDPRLAAIMPFMLRDPAWDRFGWAAPDGSHYPVYDAVRELRCQTIAGRCP